MGEFIFQTTSQKKLIIKKYISFLPTMDEHNSGIWGIYQPPEYGEPIDGAILLCKVQVDKLDYIPAIKGPSAHFKIHEVTKVLTQNG
jgi:hypothetical protein